MVTTDTGAEELAYVFAPIPGGAEHPLFRYDPTTGEAVYYLQDSMGSVIGLVDQTTTQTATFEYDGFGGERTASGALASLPVASRGDYRFHGMWLDSSVGLYYVRARVYDAGVGRFLSNDPAEGSRLLPNEVFSLSRANRASAYRFRDPSGRSSIGDLLTANVVQSVITNLAIWAYTNFIVRLRCGRLDASQVYDEFWHAILWGAIEGALSTAAGRGGLLRERGLDGVALALFEALLQSVLVRVGQIYTMQGRWPSSDEWVEIGEAASWGSFSGALEAHMDGDEGSAGEVLETVLNIIFGALQSERREGGQSCQERSGGRPGMFP
jgi:RHS repeat-associated protein